LPSHENEEGNVPLVNALVVSSVWSDWSHGRRAWVAAHTSTKAAAERQQPSFTCHQNSPAY